MAEESNVTTGASVAAPEAVAAPSAEPVQVVPVATAAASTEVAQVPLEPAKAQQPQQVPEPVAVQGDEAVKPAPAAEKKTADLSDEERVGKIQERLMKDLKEAPEFQGETPEAQKKRVEAERSLTVFDRVMFRLKEKTEPKTVPGILQNLSNEAKYLAEHARSDAKRQEYEAEAKLMTDWGSSYGRPKQIPVTEVKVTEEAHETATEKPEASATVVAETTSVSEAVPGAEAETESQAVMPAAPKMDVAAQIEAALNELPETEMIAPNVPIASNNVAPPMAAQPMMAVPGTEMQATQMTVEMPMAAQPGTEPVMMAQPAVELPTMAPIAVEPQMANQMIVGS